MKKLYLIGFALLSVLALSVIAAGSAFAEEALWLVGGSEVTTELASESTGESTVAYLAGGFLEPEAVVKCSRILDGTKGPGGIDLVTAVLALTGATAELSAMLACTNVKNCPEPLVSPQGLPWDSQLELMANGTILNKILNEAWEVLCMGLGIETLCEGQTSAVVELMTGSTALLAVTTAADLEAGGEESTCGTHTNVALEEGEEEIQLTSGEELDVSSP